MVFSTRSQRGGQNGSQGERQNNPLATSHERSEDYFLADEAATAAFGAALAARLTPGAIVSLRGELGAGKSALARAVIRALAGDPELEIPSPTFALVQPYETPRGLVLHADLYRLSDDAEIEQLGLLETPAAMVLVEWAERAPHLAAAADIEIDLTIPPGGAGRQVRLTRRAPPAPGR